ncbi:MAG: hypothetical protein OXG85_05765 [Chloroflexi bacterium]|nr:hypothetical protein [Chloroflexota bacterium]
MKQNNWLRGSVSIVEYEVSSKGIRHIRTTLTDKRPNHDPKPGADEPKPRKGDDKPDKPE